jgi:hypothetical protein
LGSAMTLLQFTFSEPPGAAMGAPTGRTHEARFSFAGIGFQVLASSGTPWELPDSYHRYVAPLAGGFSVADVVCSAQADASVPQRVEGLSHKFAIACDKQAHAWLLRGPCFEAELRQLGPRRFAVAARLASADDIQSSGAGALLLAVAWAVAERLGGLCMHGTSIELAGRAVLFVGPSGAGKSTAAALVDDAHILGADRAVLWPDHAGWKLCGLPGGSPSQLPASCEVALPLAAVLRVRHGFHTPTLEALRGAEALFAVRESVFLAESSVDTEAERLANIAHLNENVAIACLRTVLGVPLRALLLSRLMSTDVSLSKSEGVT